jgi:hypothetical protein
MCFLKWNYIELLTKINNRKTIINNSSYYIIKTGFYNCKSGLPYDIHYFKIDLDLLVLDSFNCSLLISLFVLRFLLLNFQLLSNFIQRCIL